jgi:hypothetical protein
MAAVLLGGIRPTMPDKSMFFISRQVTLFYLSHQTTLVISHKNL